jgi:hypothetical protein
MSFESFLHSSTRNSTSILSQSVTFQLEINKESGQSCVGTQGGGIWEIRHVPVKGVNHAGHGVPQRFQVLQILGAPFQLNVLRDVQLEQLLFFVQLFRLKRDESQTSVNERTIFLAVMEVVQNFIRPGDVFGFYLRAGHFFIVK